MSMNPGATTAPAASISATPRSSTLPTATIRPWSMPTSPRKRGFPEPSTKTPLRIAESIRCASRVCLDPVIQYQLQNYGYLALHGERVRIDDASFPTDAKCLALVLELINDVPREIRRFIVLGAIGHEIRPHAQLGTAVRLNANIAEAVAGLRVREFDVRRLVEQAFHALRQPLLIVGDQKQNLCRRGCFGILDIGSHDHILAAGGEQFLPLSQIPRIEQRRLLIEEFLDFVALVLASHSDTGSAAQDWSVSAPLMMR